MTQAGDKISIVECPRDAMQGLKEFIPTGQKADYINLLLEVGFDTIDFGSFVSPKAVPQMADTAEVLNRLNLSSGHTPLLAIIANLRGASDACSFEEITYLGFPLSLSETFQQRNTHKSIEEAFREIQEIQALCIKHKKILVCYLSMGFGNPYGDPYDSEYVVGFVRRLSEIGITIVSLADTVGVSDEENIRYLFTNLIPEFPAIEFGAHLHSHPATATKKIDAAYKAGCRRFDGAIKGFGGCPMAKDDLVGNMATETLINYFQKNTIPLAINTEAFDKALLKAVEVFPL